MSLELGLKEVGVPHVFSAIINKGNNRSKYMQSGKLSVIQELEYVSGNCSIHVLRL